MNARIKIPVGLAAIAVMALGIVVANLRADDGKDADQKLRCRINGLFQADRADDLREVMKQWPEVTLVSVDYELGEAEFSFDPAKAFPGRKPADWIDALNNQLGNLSNHTFGARAVCAISRDKLTKIEIPIYGLDCKACSYAAYEIVYKLPGVEQATTSFKEHRLTAWIDPDKIDQPKIEDALKKRQVSLKPPE
jgi:copper chaperone CopZ